MPLETSAQIDAKSQTFAANDTQASLSTKRDLIDLRLLATSDLHVQLLAHDYYSGKTSKTTGLARTATLIETARSEVVNSLLFDNGDFLHGGPLGEYMAQARGLEPGDIHPMIAAMNYLRYDAGTLGNHEFSEGLEFLETALAGATYPIVCANVLRGRRPSPSGARPLVQPFCFLDRFVTDGAGESHPIRIGVIGFTPPQIMVWEHHHLDGRVYVQDIVRAAMTQLPKMQQQGADLIIALSHSGIGQWLAEDAMENASTALAAVAGIDVVIAGHSHLVFPSADFETKFAIDVEGGTIGGKPAVMPGAFGSHLGVIDLILAREDGRYRVVSHRSEARAVLAPAGTGKCNREVPSHAGLIGLARDAHEETLRWIDRPVGSTSQPLNSFFADVGRSSATLLVTAAKTRFLASHLAGTEHHDLPVLAAASPLKAGGRGGPDYYTNVPAGRLLYRHAADLYIHPNTLVALHLTGKELAELLEYSASIYNQITPSSRDTPLINADFPSSSFDLFQGLNAVIDLAQPPRYDHRGRLINPRARRVAAVSLAGAELDPSVDVAVAISSFRARAGRALPPDHCGRVIATSTVSCRDLVIRHLETEPYVPQSAQHGLQFVPMPGTSVTFDTSPMARAFLGEVDGLNIAPMHKTPAGFLRFRLQL